MSPSCSSKPLSEMPEEDADLKLMDLLQQLFL